MVTYPIDHYRKSPMMDKSHKVCSEDLFVAAIFSLEWSICTKFPPRVDGIDTLPTILYLLVAFFIIEVFWREYHRNENMKKEKERIKENETMKEEKKSEQDQLKKENDQPRKENDQLRKENDQLRRENGKLQNEIESLSDVYISFQMRGKLNLRMAGRRHHCTLTGGKNFSRLWILLWIQSPPILPSSCRKGTDV
ncbi:uncharacterized protein ACBT57_013575 isoform 38-T38 [Dama dama]